MISRSDLTNRDAGAAPAADRAFTSPARLAAHWGVHVQTVYRDIHKGALPAFRLPSGRIRVRQVDAFRYGRPIE